MSLVPAVAVNPLVELAEDTLDHRVQLKQEVSVRGPGMKYVKTWVDFGAVQPGLLIPATEGGDNVRADQPSVAGDWRLKLRRGAEVNSRMRAEVTGVDDEGNEWSRLVAVRKALIPQPTELLREMLVVDVEANP